MKEAKQMKTMYLFFVFFFSNNINKLTALPFLNAIYTNSTKELKTCTEALLCKYNSIFNVFK